MSPADLNLHSALPVAEARRMISFVCPCCRQRLNVAAELAGVSGPCPACGEGIRAPQGEFVLPQGGRGLFDVTTSEIILSALAPHEEGPPAQRVSHRRAEAVERLADDDRGFQAVKRIAALPEERLDDSWREKVQRDRIYSKRRRRRERFLEQILESATARKLKQAGIIVLTGILVVTLATLYLNHRTGGALLRKAFGG